MNKLQKSIFLIFFIFLCFACENKEVVENQNIEPEIQFVKTDGLTDIPLWIPGNYPRIAVVFGHGYETEETQRRLCERKCRVQKAKTGSNVRRTEKRARNQGYE